MDLRVKKSQVSKSLVRYNSVHMTFPKQHNYKNEKQYVLPVIGDHVRKRAG